MAGLAIAVSSAEFAVVAAAYGAEVPFAVVVVSAVAVVRFAGAGYPVALGVRHGRGGDEQGAECEGKDFGHGVSIPRFFRGVMRKERFCRKKMKKVAKKC